MKPTVVALFILAGALVPGIAAQAAQPAAAPAVAVHAAGFGDNPVTNVSGYRASAQADHDARLEAARAAAAAKAAADAAAAQAAADAAAAEAAAAAVFEEADDASWSDEGSWSGGSTEEAAPAAAPAPAEAAPQPTSPRPDNNACGPCSAETLEWIVYDGVGYWACP
ncbi:hypothetical protein M3147_06635 [Agromyces mediolanus]|uniref:hypothetical protein n=1 Tax=Agromyces mediolanus TaxID=41986 RepID=UPI00203BA20D|nr:hypothetical protein [Agromyces mediolanus]MCM3656928.1 hypothetical protein [Agromyces mediolanus]